MKYIYIHTPFSSQIPELQDAENVKLAPQVALHEAPLTPQEKASYS